MMLILIHTCALSLQGEISNGQISMERQLVMNEYSLMRSALVYIARSMDSFFSDNKIPSHHRKILSLITIRLSFLIKAFPANQKTASSFLINKENCLTDYIFSAQKNQMHEHDYDQIKLLDSNWNKDKNVQYKAQLDMQRLDCDFYQGEYANYVLQDIDLCAELQNIYDSFNQEFNELALLAVQDLQLNFDFAIHLSSINEIENILSDWNSDTYHFLAKDNVQRHSIFLKKNELENLHIENAVIETENIIVFEPIDLLIKEDSALFDLLLTPGMLG